MSEAHYRLTLSIGMVEPGLVPAAFDLLRTQAKACGLSDVDKISIMLDVEVSGWVHESQVNELRARLEALWIGDVSKCEVVKPKEVEQ